MRSFAAYSSSSTAVRIGIFEARRRYNKLLVRTPVGRRAEHRCGFIINLAALSQARA